jgi:hypothetical protein
MTATATALRMGLPVAVGQLQRGWAAVRTHVFCGLVQREQ